MPITGQTFAVLLVGASLGTVRGGISALTYVRLGLMLPFYPVVGAFTGYLAEKRWDRKSSSAIGLMLTGTVLIDLIGLPWLAIVLDTNLGAR